MGSLNKAMIIGHLGQDPEVRHTQSGTTVANISVATTERYKDSSGEWQEKTEWHRVVLWGRIAEVAQEYIRKGSLVYIEGPIQTRQWEDKDGQTRYSTEIKGLTMQMLDSKGSGQSNGAPSGKGKSAPNKQAQVELEDDFDDLDDDLPF